jgi:DNA-binding CsgD family transcriptional regulator
MLTMRYLIQKNEILTELHQEIMSLQEQSTKFPVKFIRHMEKIITQGLDSQTEEWKNATNVLKLSQQGFFKRLKDKYPNLTPNDLRLSSYLRMNFTTKEIAKLLNISARAVEISRYRLRRKLSLGHDENLTEYLIKESESEE